MILSALPTASPLRGSLRPPGDKSISHRALIFSGLAEGRSRITGLLRGEDVLATLAAMRQLGAGIEEQGDVLVVDGVGQAGLSAPDSDLDMGNSGTAMRLLAGVLAAQPFDSVLTGDASLTSRPMRRVLAPLSAMGASIEASGEGTAPLRIKGSPGLQAIDYESPVASAQVKSCVLLAGLYAQGDTSVREPRLSRDHTERMLPLFGVDLVGDCAVRGGSRLRAADIDVPADPSSAAFPVAAALLVPGSEIDIASVGLNPTRTGFYRAIERMGADLDISPSGQVGREPVGDLRVRYGGRLRGIDLPEAWIPSMIDEIPALLVLAATADGLTRIRGAEELRVKESDRLAVMASALQAMGIKVEEYPDGIDVVGGSPVSAHVEAADDHRCAMSLASLAQVVEGGLRIRGAGLIDTSYPGFSAQMATIGAGHMRLDK